MKKIVLLLLGVTLLTSVRAQDQKFRFGLTASPAVTWAKGFASEVSGGKIRMGVDYGLLMDVNFSENYALSTGATIILTGGNTKFAPMFLSDTITQSVTAQFRMQYLRLPISFKLKTNQIGYITYWGSFGVVPAFRLQGRVKAKRGSQTLYEDENLIRNNVTLFNASVIQLGLEVAGGIEYSLGGRAALLLGLVYQNAFINAIDDGDNEKIVFNHVALRAGIMF